MEELNSSTSPGWGWSVGGTTSSPVGMIPTTGRVNTSTASTPPAIMAPMAAGVTGVWVGRSISPAHTSSPICRMCCQGAAASWRTAFSPSHSTSSIITTASFPSGRGSPVSTTVNCVGSRVTGVVSVAPKVSAAATAMPSMAQAG